MDTYCYWECKIVQLHTKTSTDQLQISFSALQSLDKHTLVLGYLFIESLFIIGNIWKGLNASCTLVYIYILAGNTDQFIYRKGNEKDH